MTGRTAEGQIRHILAPHQDAETKLYALPTTALEKAFKGELQRDEDSWTPFVSRYQDRRGGIGISADAATEARLADHAPQRTANQPPPGDWHPIHGELITFPDPARDFPPIDRLEGFRFGQDSFYERVLVAARTPNGTPKAWLYVAWHCLIGSGERIRNRAWMPK